MNSLIYTVNTNTLLPGDVFENLQNKCPELYELDPVHFLTAPELAWHAAFKKIEAKLKLLTKFDMLLIVEKGIRGRLCDAVNRYVKYNNK